MWLTKGLLIAAPTIVSLFLLQSYLWVPTFENQASGDPGGLTPYISSSIADAVILNPTLSADSASSEVNALVFEGLIDRDLDLSFWGRLAQSWQLLAGGRGGGAPPAPPLPRPCSGGSGPRRPPGRRRSAAWRR